MFVETFEVAELDHEGTVECEAEAIALIEQLGLDGQTKLLNKTSGEVRRVPYRKLTKCEAFVYELVCPKKSKLKEYADAPIPLRVLQVAAHASELFDRIQVWSAVDSDIKDPVLVGCNGREYGPEERFLLARWGEELEQFNVLAEKACALFRQKYKAEAAKIMSRCKSAMESIDAIEGEALAGLAIPVAYHMD